jgi:tetratricopeptide (TPR) repeat protein
VHFDRGVTLYGETDYPGALVEFKRAYALSPNSAVLYNIGEAQYQIQDYASALVTFTRYLVEVPPGGPHRGEVENNVEVLRTRVGHLTIVTVAPGADVSVDDRPAGKTPFDDRCSSASGIGK